MIVADSSYIAEGILNDASLFAGERLLTPDLSVYEAAGAVWKHEALLRKIRDGRSYLEALDGLLETNALLAVAPDRALLRRAYELAVRHRAHPRDTIFVALALETGLTLKTYDPAQMAIFEQEKAGAGAGASPRGRPP